MKRERTVEMERLQSTINELEADLAGARAGKEEIEKSLKMTQQRAAIERQNQDRIHMDTIKVQWSLSYCCHWKPSQRALVQTVHSILFWSFRFRVAIMPSWTSIIWIESCTLEPSMELLHHSLWCSKRLGRTMIASATALLINHILFASTLF